jgi:predicted ATPase/DNA-binding SARP family transcriptional activator
MAGGHFAVLGPLEVRDPAGRSVSLGGQKPRELLAVLLLNRGQTLSVDRLVMHLWGETASVGAAITLRTHVARVRKVLQDAGDPPDVLANHLGGYRLEVDAETVDAEVFEALVGDGQRAITEQRPTQAITVLEQALHLWRGEVLEDLGTPDFATTTATRLNELRMVAWEHHVDSVLATGRHAEAISRLQQLVEEYPFRERFTAQLMLALYRSGRQAEALATFASARRRLAEELGLDPGPGLRELETSMLRHEPSLQAPSLSHVSSFGGQRWEVEAASRARVPSPATPTIGRQRDIVDVVALLESHRIVTLLGPGGVGKTRLATEAARHFAETTGEPTCYVDLTRALERDAVPGLLATSLGVDVVQAENATRALEEALGGRSMLIVLDNFEHVADAADLIGRLARCSPDLRMLITSRTRLRLAGEQVYDVARLGVEPESRGPGAQGPSDAVALFTQAATAVDQTFRLDDCLEDVTAICRLVDGLPLAIELAAGHVRTLPPALLRSQLVERLGSPSGAARDLPPRQQTIPATIDWSLQLLSEAERSLFVRLGVFLGPVPLPVIERVCADPGEEIVEPLSRLSDHSLVHRTSGADGEPRFGLLELMRERATGLLDGQEEIRVRDRHAVCLADLLDSTEATYLMRGPQLDVVIEWLPEVRAAHAWAEACDNVVLMGRLAAGLGEYWNHEGNHAEGRTWVAEPLARRDDLDELLRARLELIAGILEWPHDRSVARGHWQRAIDGFTELGDGRHLAYCMARAALTRVGEAESYDAALRTCDQAIELARAAGDDDLLYRTINIKGEVARVHGDDDVALPAYEEARRLAAKANDDAQLAIVLGNLSFLAEHRGDYLEARELSHEAVSLAWSTGRRLMAGWTLAQLAGAELGLGNVELSARLIGASDNALALAGVDRHPCDVPEYDRTVAALQGKLGDKRLARLRSEGGSLSLDDAVAVALANPAVPDGHPTT